MRTLSKIWVLFLVLAIVASSYAEGFQYESRGKRDPFVPLVGMDRPTVTRLEDVTSADDVKLEGIATGAGGIQVAMVNGELLKEGSKVGEVEIGKISKKHITILIGQKAYDIYLPGEEGGTKGGK
jgi:hypothetical protein